MIGCTSTEVGIILDQDVGRVLGTHGAGLKEAKPRLHEQDNDAHHGQEEVIRIFLESLEAIVVLDLDGLDVRIVGRHFCD